MTDRIDGGEAVFLEFRSREVDKTVERYRRHDVDEEAGRLAKYLIGKHVTTW